MRSKVHWRLSAALSLLLGLPGAGSAGIALSEVPLFLTSGSTPNIVVTVDDSGSMERGYLPESIGASEQKLNSALFTASSYNGMYYNPRTTYQVPVRGDGIVYSTRFTAAHVNGFDPSRGAVNLANPGYRPISRCAPAELSASCSRTAGAGTSSDSSPVTYTYGGCTAQFRDRGRSVDQILVTGCGLPATGDGSPAAADKGIIVVSSSGSRKEFSSTGSTPTSGGTLISLSGTAQLGSSGTIPGLTFSWTRTPRTVGAMASAYYHLFYTQAQASKPANCSVGESTGYGREDRDCYVLVEVGSLQDVASGTPEQKKQNFANWYSFYRTRALAAMSAGINAVSALGRDQVRLGWQTLNNGGCDAFGTSCKGYDLASHENRIRTLDGLKAGSGAVTHRSDFYDWISRLQVGGATPLRSALQRAGEYFSKAGRDGPYAQDPYVTLGTELSCRRNFHVMMTDGLWNADAGTDFGGDVDAVPRTLPDGKSYTPRAPYRSAGSLPAGMSHRNTLADIAFKYWATDLRSSTRGSPALDDNLAPYTVDRTGSSEQQYWNPRNDVASWQHMVNYMIGFGLGTQLTDPIWAGSTYGGDYPALASGTKTWPPVDETAAFNAEPVGHVYDLWHAAINSRGQFFSAEDPAGINNAFRSAFSSILLANPSSAAVAANSTSIQTNTLLYQARYDSSDWHGELVAYHVSSDGTTGSAVWDAAQRMPAAGARKITTWSGSSGVNFRNCNADLTAAQQAALNQNPASIVDNRCQDRLEWLRGDASREQRNGGTWRDRTVTVLGDLVNSDPMYVGREDLGYASSTLPEAGSYAAFVAAKATRVPMVYVGGNDGMLHGFRADAGAANSGQELMAHVPAAVFGKLNRLMEPGYEHTYFVDGPPNATDAYLGGAWKTVLVGGLGAGGKTVYALDVTDPGNHGPSKVLWEFTDTDLGYTLSQPQIGRLASGRWVAVFGNGFNSGSDKAFLYVVDLASGARLAKIAAGTATSNGLATPVLVDGNNDRIAEYAYAGDLQGNLWKFDLAANTATVLFTARGPSGQVQPITAKPAWTVPTTRPAGGVMVFFGTGQYLSGTDLANTAVQTFYGVWDNNSDGVVTRAQLQPQTIDAQTGQFGYDLRETSANNVNYPTQRGWFMDLVPTTGPDGERVDSVPLYRYGRIIFVTTRPSSDACAPGGSSWLMELDAFSGSRTPQSVFDFNSDGAFDRGDLLSSGNTASGVRSPVGIVRTPAWLDQSRSSELAFKLMAGSAGGIFSLRNRKPAQVGAVRRLMWQQLQ
ncbi:MAG TPA: PilC/PilY family type IV pilus protein [Ramlibacter sp.]